MKIETQKVGVHIYLGTDELILWQTKPFGKLSRTIQVAINVK